jgi:hypothetical protein
MKTPRRIVRYFETALETATIRALEQFHGGDIVCLLYQLYLAQPLPFQSHVNFLGVNEVDLIGMWMRMSVIVMGQKSSK